MEEVLLLLSASHPRPRCRHCCVEDAGRVQREVQNVPTGAGNFFPSNDIAAKFTGMRTPAVKKVMDCGNGSTMRASSDEVDS